MLEVFSNTIFDLINQGVQGFNRLFIEFLGPSANFGVVGLAIFLAYLYRRRSESGWVETIFIALVFYGFFRFIGLGI